MEPFDALTAKDKNIFCKYLNYFGNANPTVSLPYLLRFWNTNKADLFTAFGEKLTLRKTVHYKRNKGQIRDDFENVFFAPGTDAANAREDIVSALIDYGTHVFLNDKLNSEYYQPIPREYYWFTSLCSIFYLMENVYLGETYTIPTPDGKKFKIQKGCHVLPTLRKICRFIGVPEETYETVRLAQSRALNDANIVGTLCLSIAPIDYVSMSDNACGWDSCMAWYDHNGEYRAGTIEMMNSPYVIVAYLDNDSPFYPFSNYDNDKDRISNKRWRQLIIANKDLIIGNRQYPFENDSLEMAALKWTRELMGSLGYSYEDQPSYFLNSCLRSVGHGPHLSFSTNLMYNDIYGQRTMFLSPTFLKDFPTLYTLNFSGESECMLCGELMSSDSDTSWVVCGDCQGVKVCSNCGAYILDGDSYTENSNGEIFCESCISSSDSLGICSCCLEPYYDDELEFIEYYPINGSYPHDVCACPNCLPSDNSFGPKDEDGDYFAENFTREGIEFIESCGEIVKEPY